MKILKEDSEIAKKIIRVESLMDELGITVEVTGSALFVTVDGMSLRLIDTESGDPSYSFPRMFDSERFEKF